MVNPLPGAAPRWLRDTLRDLASSVSNLKSPQPGWQTRDWLAAYIEWANNAASSLHGQIATREIERLVWTGRHHLLASKIGLLYPDLENSGISHVLTAEMDDRAKAFTLAHDDLVQRISRWDKPGTLVAFDTSVYINAAKLEEIDIAGLMSLTARNGPIRLVVPMAVIDELDNLKQGGKQHTRWRAAYTTAVLHRVLRVHPAEPAALHDDKPNLTIELLSDPPGHVRLPITDDEIIDRVASVQVLTDRKITLITYDTGQALRANLAGVDTQRLRLPIEDEPEPTA